MKIGKRKICFLIIFYLFLFWNILKKKAGIFQYVDDTVAFLAIPFFIRDLSKNHFVLQSKKRGYGRYIVLLVIIGLAGNIWFHYQPLKAVIADMYLMVKFWLAIYVGKYLGRYFDIQKNASFIYFHVKVMVWLYGFLIIVDILSGGIFQAEIRYGLRSTQLLYEHSTYFVGCCMLLIVVLLSISIGDGKKEKYLVCLLIFLCTSLRSKAFAIAMICVYIYWYIYIRNKKIKIRTIFKILPVVIIVGWNQIMFYFFNEGNADYARYQLLTKSIQIACDHFPLGSGFASFGSYYSGVYYSILYKIYGISNVHGLRKGASWFISDSFWPMVLAQFGWFGLIAFGIALFMLCSEIQKLWKISEEYYISGLSILAYLLVSSTAESAFVHPLAIPLAVWLGLLFYKKEKM